MPQTGVDAAASVRLALSFQAVMREAAVLLGRAALAELNAGRVPGGWAVCRLQDKHRSHCPYSGADTDQKLPLVTGKNNYRTQLSARLRRA